MLMSVNDVNRSVSVDQTFTSTSSRLDIMRPLYDQYYCSIILYNIIDILSREII